MIWRIESTNTSYRLFQTNTAYSYSNDQYGIFSQLNMPYQSSETTSDLCMTMSSKKELVQPYEEPERVLRSIRRLFRTRNLDYSSSPEFDLSDHENHFEAEITEAMAETKEQYMTKTRDDYGSRIARPKFDDKAKFELKGQFLKELCENTFSGSDNEDANEHIEKVLEIADLFIVPDVTQDQLMLRIFPISLTRAASRWIRNESAGSITTWEILKGKFLSKYFPPARTAKKMEEINNFQQEPEVILFYKGLYVPTRQILDSKGVVPSMNTVNAKKAIQEMADYSQKWHNRISTRCKSSDTSDRLAAIQAQLNNLGREIKKVNEKVYVAQVRCELCNGPHYTKVFR
ncbi:retrovirus-related pol polyprotein from transposon TNT 1-94 [Tanacetum coccineum]